VQLLRQCSLKRDDLASRRAARIYDLLLNAAILRTILAALIGRAGKIRNDAQADITVEHMLNKALA
jgi:hypothetical protein